MAARVLPISCDISLFTGVRLLLLSLVVLCRGAGLLCGDGSRIPYAVFLRLVQRRLLACLLVYTQDFEVSKLIPSKHLNHRCLAQCIWNLKRMSDIVMKGNEGADSCWLLVHPMLLLQAKGLLQHSAAGRGKPRERMHLRAF